jgi:cytochrome bd-type quinol oxidase subunit 1
MNYPFLDIPVIGSGWMIGIIAIIHVLISHFAVGGGIVLVFAERKALAENRQDWIERLIGFSKFFMILTGVFGALTGVGIWFSIGLANPEGTSTLIHNFVFGWAIEWVFFLVELSLASAYYYTWRRISDKDHLALGWAYAVASLGTLVIINGILTFKLTPGAWLPIAGTGREAEYFFQAFFNPGYFPALGLRVLVCITLAGAWALVFFSRLDGEKDGAVKTSMVRWATKWFLPAFFLMPVFGAWFFTTIPHDQRALLELGIATAGQGAFTHVTRMALMVVICSATIGAVVYLFAWVSPKSFGLGNALLVLMLAGMATACGESMREFLRKPFIVRGYLYSNGTRVKDVAKRNAEGYLAHSPWLVRGEGADSTALSKYEVGKRMFQGQCMSCHTVDGYRSMRRLLKDRDNRSIANVLAMLHDDKPDSPYRKFMPPLVGRPEEIDALRFYLNHLENGDATAKAP